MLVPDLCLHNLLLNLELHESLGFDLRVLLQGCVRSLKLHCLLISDHHLLLYFLPVVFLLCNLLTLQLKRLLPLFGVIHDVLAPEEKLAFHGLVLDCKQLCGLLLLLWVSQHLLLHPQQLLPLLNHKTAVILASHLLFHEPLLAHPKVIIHVSIPG